MAQHLKLYKCTITRVWLWKYTYCVQYSKKKTWFLSEILVSCTLLLRMVQVSAAQVLVASYTNVVHDVIHYVLQTSALMSCHVYTVLCHKRSQNCRLPMWYVTHCVPSENWPVLRRYGLHKHLSPFLSRRIQPLSSRRPRSVRAEAVILGYNNPGCHRQESCQPHCAAGTKWIKSCEWV